MSGEIRKPHLGGALDYRLGVVGEDGSFMEGPPQRMSRAEL